MSRFLTDSSSKFIENYKISLFSTIWFRFDIIRLQVPPYTRHSKVKFVASSLRKVVRVPISRHSLMQVQGQPDGVSVPGDASVYFRTLT